MVKMKIVREHINEKFEDISDPVRDLGIGILHKVTSETLEIIGALEEKSLAPEDLKSDLRGETQPSLQPEFVIAAWEMLKGKLEFGQKYNRYADGDDEIGLEEYVDDHSKGRYVYDATPWSDEEILVVFSKVKLPKCKKVFEEE